MFYYITFLLLLATIIFAIDSRIKEENNSVNPIKYHVRKCCQEYEYYSTLSHECEPTFDNELFSRSITHYLVNKDVGEYKMQHGKIPKCPATFKKPFTDVILTNSSHVLWENGTVFEIKFQHDYDLQHYCLELAGEDLDNTNLVLAYCPGQRAIIPKCCPSNQYFDTNVHDCIGHPTNGTGDTSLMPYLTEGHILKHQGDLLCTDIPIKLDMEDTSFTGNNLCIYNMEECYRMDKFCIDNMKEKKEMTVSAYVCPDFFINKCCPEGLTLHKSGCVESIRHSISLIHILKNYRYQIKGVSGQGTQCSPFTIEDETRSDIKWYIDSYGLAVITNVNKTIYTKNFCVDDYMIDDDVFPVIKVCSEEIEVYHEVSHIEDWDDAIGKCCPTNRIFHPNVTTIDNYTSCLPFSEFTGRTDTIPSLEELNIDKLVFANFPSCKGFDSYHHYFLMEQTRDYATISDDRSLVVVEKEGRCKMKETTVHPSDFCIDYMVFGNELRAAAIICAPSVDNYHIERNPIVVSLILLSCAALLMTFFTLILMRVRRGMITVKKVNTLAGRILISYVCSQLIGYVVLCVGTLVDFEQDSQKCFILAGFLLFFLIAAFCWNSSICLEGLLLTMHIRIPEKRRFIYHCIWGWGVPGIITTLALLKDVYGGESECDVLTPKFGKHRCFFSDPLAQLIYFYIPITITVIFNALLLVAAKILRRSQLKKLERDPHRIKRHGTLKQVFSIQGIRGKFHHDQETTDKSHSGLRTHQNKNIWIESIKLVLWSGITWMLEVAGTLISIYSGRSRGQWYQYLWYIPVAFNCLRGLGIFVIIVLTTDNKTHFVHTVRVVGSNVTKMLTTVRLQRDVAEKRFRRATVKRPRRQSSENGRKESVSTVVTNISQSSNLTEVPSQFYHSVSQNDWTIEAPLQEVFEETDGSVSGIWTTLRDKTRPQTTIPLDEMEFCTHL